MDHILLLLLLPPYPAFSFRAQPQTKALTTVNISRLISCHWLAFSSSLEMRPDPLPQLIQLFYTLKFETWVSGCRGLVRYGRVGGYVDLLPFWGDIEPIDVNEDQTVLRRAHWMVRKRGGWTIIRRGRTRGEKWEVNYNK